MHSTKKLIASPYLKKLKSIAYFFAPAPRMSNTPCVNNSNNTSYSTSNKELEAICRYGIENVAMDTMKYNHNDISTLLISRCNNCKTPVNQNDCYNQNKCEFGKKNEVKFS